MQDHGGVISENSGPAVDQDELLLQHGGAYSGTGEWNSRFYSVAAKISKYSNAECRYKHHSFTKTAVCRQSLRVC